MQVKPSERLSTHSSLNSTCPSSHRYHGRSLWMQLEEETTYHLELGGREEPQSLSEHNKEEQRKLAKKPDLSHLCLCISPNLTIHLVIHFGNKHVLSTFCVPGTVLSTGDTVVNKTE